MSKDIPNVNAMGAYAAVGGALAVMAVGTALGEGLKAGIWSARENSIRKQNAKNIDAMHANARTLYDQTQTLLARMIDKHEGYPKLTQKMSIDIVLKHSLAVDESVELLSDNGFDLIKALREIGLQMIADIRELDMYADEEVLMELESE